MKKDKYEEIVDTIDNSGWADLKIENKMVNFFTSGNKPFLSIPRENFLFLFKNNQGIYDVVLKEGFLLSDLTGGVYFDFESLLEVMNNDTSSDIKKSIEETNKSLEKANQYLKKIYKVSFLIRPFYYQKAMIL